MSPPDSKSQFDQLAMLTIDINSAAGSIVASLSASEISEALSLEDVLNKLELLGVSDWDIKLQKIEELISDSQKGTQGQYEIGRKRDASLVVSVSPDKMVATAYITPAKGDCLLTAEAIIKTLTQLGISKKRIVQPAIKQAISTTLECEIEVARGLQPRRGKDTQFVELISDQAPNKIEPDSNELVDYLAGRSYSNVIKGAALLERIPAQPGKVGQDIFGHIVQPEHGTDIPFDLPFSGASLDLENPNLVIADIDGHPVYLPGKVNVDPTLRFENIDLSTGHVKFNGSIEVNGDVMPGLKVEASGDIFIKGVVERAELKSGANITIQGGIVGDAIPESSPQTAPLGDADKESKKTSPEDSTDYPCAVMALGNLSLKYANEAKLIANNIFAKEYIFNSFVKVQQGLYLGQSGGHGKIAGGQIIAGHCVIGKELGSPAYQKTTIAINQNDHEKEYKKLVFLQEKRTEQVLRLHQLLDSLPASQAESVESISAKKSVKINEALSDLDFMLAEIKQRLANIDQARVSEQAPFIQATQRCYPNCFIAINGVKLVTQDESKACTLARKGQKISINH